MIRDAHWKGKSALPAFKKPNPYDEPTMGPMTFHFNSDGITIVIDRQFAANAPARMLAHSFTWEQLEEYRKRAQAFAGKP